ncbi:MAG TPA: glycosyltransferase [Dehalococcoidia bacterium]|nr:glycosyltransferase [Dehalococcoidia bacterium]
MNDRDSAERPCDAPSHQAQEWARGRHVLLVLQSDDVGGMETHCVDLAGEFVKCGMRVTAVLPCNLVFDLIASRMLARGADVRRIDLDARNGRLAEAMSLNRFARLLRALRPDIVHLHTGGATGGLAVIALARLASNATVVLTEHDVPRENPRFYQRFTRWSVDRLLHVLVAVSRRNASLRCERLSSRPRRFVAILNGVPLRDISASERAQHRARIRESLGIGLDTVTLGSVVRLEPGKGLADLLEAFALVRRERPCELVLVGDGRLRQQLETLSDELGLTGSVHFAGYQPDPVPYLAAFDVFVLAVPKGSMSIALLEAMDFGLPAVITFGGPEEAVIPEVTGITSPPANPPALAQALGRLVDDALLRQRLGAAARQHVGIHFSSRRVARDLLDAYRSRQEPCAAARLAASRPPTPYPGA